MSNLIISNEPEQNELGRRSLVGQFGGAAATIMAVGAAVTGGVALTSQPAAAQAVTDADIANFALNLEYLEAEYYIHALNRMLELGRPNSIRTA